jgi:type II secretory pathway component PulK
MSRTRNAQRGAGAAMLVVMIVMAALMTAGGLAIYVSTSETRSTGYVAANRQALFCAEAGLAAARSMVTSNYAQWGSVLDADAGNDPTWYPIRGYLADDGTGDYDYEVTIRDNDDEIAPATPRTVTELVQYQGGGYTYRNQSGQGAGNTGNAN